MAEPERSPGSYNLLSVSGAVLTTVSAVLFLVFFFLDAFGFHSNPYLGIVTFLILPAIFVCGLLLIPLGFWRARRRAARGHPDRRWPVLDFGRASVRRTALIILVLSGVNVAIIALAGFESVEYADSTDFCTGVCHTPMEPEAVAHARSVHASVSCASCHVGPGAPGFVSAKMGGVRRLAAVVTNSYERPIPVPVRDLPSAIGTCAGCHSPTTYAGDRVRQFRYFSDDEATTEQATTMTLRVGGGGWEAGGPQGIHWHASPQTRIEYIATDATRETIPWVRVAADARGEPREFVADGFTPEQAAAGERRVMDCTDCHNRQGHSIAATPDRAVDEALARGLLPQSLPFIRREAIAAVTDASRDRATAIREIGERLSSFYAQQPGLAGDARVAQAIAATERLYAGHVFPSMNVKWGTYPNHLGHTDSPGCFRCHDDAKERRLVVSSVRIAKAVIGCSNGEGSLICIGTSQCWVLRSGSACLSCARCRGHRQCRPRHRPLRLLLRFP